MFSLYSLFVSYFLRIETEREWIVIYNIKVSGCKIAFRTFNLGWSVLWLYFFQWNFEMLKVFNFQSKIKLKKKSQLRSFIFLFSKNKAFYFYLETGDKCKRPGVEWTRRIDCKSQLMSNLDSYFQLVFIDLWNREV